jgi:hypothetical protein
MRPDHTVFRTVAEFQPNTVFTTTATVEPDFCPRTSHERGPVEMHFLPLEILTETGRLPFGPRAHHFTCTFPFVRDTTVTRRSILVTTMRPEAVTSTTIPSDACQSPSSSPWAMTSAVQVPWSPLTPGRTNLAKRVAGSRGRSRLRYWSDDPLLAKHHTRASVAFVASRSSAVTPITRSLPSNAPFTAGLTGLATLVRTEKRLSLRPTALPAAATTSWTVRGFRPVKVHVRPSPTLTVHGGRPATVRTAGSVMGLPPSSRDTFAVTESEVLVRDTSNVGAVMFTCTGGPVTGAARADPFVATTLTV